MIKRLPLSRELSLLLLVIGLLGAVAQDAYAYAFGVAPIRLELDSAVRSGAITVSNDDKVSLGFQMRLMRWTQDAKGMDRYEESDDLVYFPRLMTIEPAQKRVIRVGTKGAPGKVEKTYRLFIEEMLKPKTGGDGTKIAVRMRFAVPIFVAPENAVTQGEIAGVRQEARTFRFQIKNRGTRHLKIETLSLKRGDGTLVEAVGGYVLAGVTRDFSLVLKPEDCRQPGPLELRVKGEPFELKQTVPTDPARCGS